MYISLSLSLSLSLSIYIYIYIYMHTQHLTFSGMHPRQVSEPRCARAPLRSAGGRVCGGCAQRIYEQSYSFDKSLSYVSIHYNIIPNMSYR